MIFFYIFVQGFRNDFQEAMDQVDQAYLDEILALGTHVSTCISTYIIYYKYNFKKCVYNIPKFKI